MRLVRVNAVFGKHQRHQSPIHIYNLNINRYMVIGVSFSYAPTVPVMSVSMDMQLFVSPNHWKDIDDDTLCARISTSDSTTQGESVLTATTKQGLRFYIQNKEYGIKQNGMSPIYRLRFRYEHPIAQDDYILFGVTNGGTTMNEVIEKYCITVGAYLDKNPEDIKTMTKEEVKESLCSLNTETPQNRKESDDEVIIV